MDRWPQSLRDLAGIIGADAALILAREAGGLRHYVPSRARPGHPWARLIGMAAFTRLCEHYGNGELELPRAAALDDLRPQIEDLARQGVPRREIARRLGCTERYARMVANAEPNAQCRLPGM
ncbi:MAG: hypothetical protein PWQ57_889 [Desulfovibrionales bacterium]|jgi:hypothetical protein|nr:hypothetical protein [Desulfovibrionales bacterium]